MKWQSSTSSTSSWVCWVGLDWVGLGRVGGLGWVGLVLDVWLSVVHIFWASSLATERHRILFWAVSFTSTIFSYLYVCCQPVDFHELYFPSFAINLNQLE